MRLMRRVAGDVFTILSLALCLASIAAWAHFGAMRVGFSVSPTEHTQFATLAVERVLVVRFSSVPWPIGTRAEIQRGNLSIGAVTPNTSDVGDSISNGRATQNWSWEIGDLWVARRAYSYASLSGRAPYLAIDWELILPYWLIILLSILPPAWWLLVQR